MKSKEIMRNIINLEKQEHIFILGEEQLEAPAVLAITRLQSEMLQVASGPRRSQPANRPTSH